MFYCSNCKKSTESANCPTCGKVFTRADEIVHCPSCNKMFFKPSRDFSCTRCGTLVQVNPNQNQPQQQTAQMYSQGNMQNQSFGQNATFAPPNPFANSQVPNPQMQNQIVQPQNQSQQTINTTNFQTLQPSPQVSANLDSNVQNNQAFTTQNMQNTNIQPMVNNVSRNQNMSEPNSIPNQSMQNEQVMAQNAQSNLGQQANAQSMPAQDQVDFASLFGQTNLSSQNEQTSNTSFEDLRAEEESNISQNTQTDDGKVYDENGYEVVDLTGAKKSKKNKKKEKKSKDNQLNNLETQNYFNQSNSNAETEVVKSSKGMKIFAFVELFLLIISVVVIGYLTLGQYIMTDPCQRTWKEYQNAEKLRVSEEGFKEIEIIKALVSEDGTYAIYKVKGEGNNNVVIFKIEKGFSISTFFDMSTAKIYGFAAEQDIAKEMLPDVKWQDNK